MGKSWNRTDCERLLHKLVLEGYLTEELVVNKEDIALAYARPGPKADEFISNLNIKVSYLD